MDMKKILTKAALITIAALIGAGILIFSLWILIFPKSMASFSEELGNYKFAVTCANLKYKYSGSTEDLARCAEDSILSGKDKLVIEYCGQLKEKDDFEALCIQRNEELKKTQFGQHTTGYKTYILGNLAVAQYRAGDLKEAVNTAELGEKECFTKLVIEIILNGTEEDLKNIQTYPKNEDAVKYIQKIIKSVK